MTQGRSRLLLLTSIALGLAWSLTGSPALAETGSLSGPFYVQSYLGKCLTYGSLRMPVERPPVSSGSPVYISECRTDWRRVAVDAVFQQIVVEEVNERHEVVLRAGNKVIGVAGGFLIAQAPLVLQDYVPNSPAQTFALDGDSIILPYDRNLVVEVKYGRGATGTPLWLGNRDLDDTEFWTFASVDGRNRKPTTGFVRVPQEEPSLAAAVFHASWGDVIEIVSDTIVMIDPGPMIVSAGVTIRGNRRFTLQGPEIFAQYTTHQLEPPKGLLVIAGDHARITGIRLRGPTRDPDATGLRANGIHVPNREGELYGPVKGLIIDHNDLSDWTTAAVNLDENNASRSCEEVGHPDPGNRVYVVRVVRNFIHDQRNDEGSGYGVVVGSGAFGSIVGNTFLQNRHSIAGDGTALSGYSAWFNLVLSRATRYGFSYEQDFDMHGSTGGYGPPGGADVEIARNTFLGTNRDSVWLRGAPCGADRFSQNIVRNSEDSIRWYSDSGDSNEGPPFPIWLDVTADNRFESPDPTDQLGVADFDGDGRDDLFLATGTAWYFAPAGNAEWRYINAQTDEIDDLLFGDFDGDGRADVFTKHGRDWVVSWGGLSRWEKINESDAGLEDFAIGDFNGDRRADVFYASGTYWYVSYGGVGPFTLYAASSYRIPNLRFGNFDGDLKTDVFGVVAGDWMIVHGGTDTWAPLRSPALTNSVDGLVVADFDGNGLDDVATTDNSSFLTFWEISRDGVGGWELLRLANQPLTQVPAIGRFDDSLGADVLIWASTSLDICSSGSGGPHLHSRQDMR